jgi:hypothetical protein
MRRFLILFALSLAFVRPCSSQIPVSVGIPSQQFNFFAASQQADELCWAASIQMILNYYGIPISQAQIVQRTYGQLVNHSGSDAQINGNLNGLAIRLDGTPHIVRSAMGAGLPPPGVLINQLSQGHPFLLTFATGAYSGHAVVITGATYYPSSNGPFIQSIILRDPWPSDQNKANDGRVEVSGSDLAAFGRIVRNNWLISVQ